MPFKQRIMWYRWMAFKVNKLSLNVNNSKYMLFNAGNKILYPFEIKIDYISIERMYVFNFLGLIMDEHLNWKSHVEKISNKCSKIIGVLNILKYFLPLTVKLIYIYNSILIWGLTILKSGARTPRTVTKFAVKTAIDLTQTIQGWNFNFRSISIVFCPFCELIFLTSGLEPN